MLSQVDQKNALRVTEIFYSLQGESYAAGWPTVFVRLTGCPLRCQYCDTAYAFQGGQRLSFDEIIQTIQAYSVKHLTLTGGEPLAQPGSLLLLKQFCDLGYEVSLETSGALDVSGVDERVIKVLDVKTPASLEADKNRIQNFDYLQTKDQVKFVICHREDYEWAKTFVSQHQLTQRCTVWFSPSYQQLEPRWLADWMLEDQLPIRLQLQWHKLLWGEVPGV